MVSVPSLARFRTERHMTEMELNTRIAELEEEQIKPAPPSRSWEYRRGQSTKRLIRLYKIVTSSYVPHAGYVDWSFEGEHPVPSGKYIKYPNNSNCQRWIKRQTSKRVYVYEDKLRDDLFKEKVGKISPKELSRTTKERRVGSLGYAEARLIAYNHRMRNPLRMSRLQTWTTIRKLWIFD